MQPVDSATPLDETRPQSITNALQFRNAIQGGDVNTQTQMLKLIKGIFNPQMPMAIWSSGDSFTQMQKITAIKQMKPEIESNGTTHDRAFVIHPYNPSHPVLCLYDVREGTSVALPFFGTSQAPPAILFKDKTWVHEANQPMLPSPLPASIATRARINSLRLLIAEAGTTADKTYTNGAVNATTASDVRKLEALDPSKMAANANIDKNVVSNARLQQGVVSILGPYIGDMTIANPLFEGGLGQAGEAINVLTTPVDFNYSAGLVNSVIAWVNPLTPPAAGAQIGPTLGANGPLMNDIVWISSKTTLSAGSARVRNVALPNIGFENYPEFTLTCLVPANCSPFGPGPDPAQFLPGSSNLAPAVSPQSVHVIHFYVNANGTTLQFEKRGETIAIPVPQFSATEPVTYFGEAALGVTNGIPSTLYTENHFVGQRRQVKIASRAPPLDNYTWIGTMVQCVDETWFPSGFLGSAGATGPSQWSNAQYTNCAQLLQQPSSGQPANAPWFGITNTELLPLIKPQLVGVDVEIPRLYDAGNLSATLITVTNVTAGQTYNVELHAQLELTASGDVTVFQKAGADVTITDMSAVQLLQMAFDTPGNDLKVNYPLPLYKEFEAQIAAAKTFEDLMRIEAFRTPKFIQAATSAGLFGSLGGALGGMFGGQQGAQIGSMIGNLGDQFTPLLAAGRYGDVAKPGRYPLSTGMFGYGDSTGMFGYEDDDEEDDEEAPSARAAFGLRLVDGKRVGPPRTLPGNNPGLPGGILVSHMTVTRFIDAAMRTMKDFSSIQDGGALTPPQLVQRQAKNGKWQIEFYQPAQLLVFMRQVQSNVVALLKNAMRSGDQTLVSIVEAFNKLGFRALNIAADAAIMPIMDDQSMRAWITAFAGAGFSIKPKSVGRLISGFSGGSGKADEPLAEVFQGWYNKTPADEFNQTVANRYMYYGFINCRLLFAAFGLPAALFVGPAANLNPYVGTKYQNSRRGMRMWVPVNYTPAEYVQWQAVQTAAAKQAWSGRGRKAAVRRYQGGYGAAGMFGAEDDDDDDDDFTPQRRIESYPQRRSITQMGI